MKGNGWSRTFCPSKKRTYASKSQAKQAAKRASARLYVYRCPDCKNWHLTKQKPHTAQSRAARHAGLMNRLFIELFGYIP